MATHITAYLCTALVFLGIDALWLSVIARKFYATRMGALLLERPRFAIAMVFYAVYVVGLVYFAVAPAIDAGDWRVAAMDGALFGFFAYLTYDATNLATLKGFPPVVAIVDTVWGTVLSAASATAGYGLASAL